MDVPFIRIGRLPCIMMILLSIGLLNHVIIAPLVIQTSGRDAWIAILLAALLLPIWLLLIYPVVRSVGTQRFSEWLSARAGRWNKWLVIAAHIALLLVVIGITAVDTIMWGATTYLQETPKTLTAMLFLAICIAGSVLGMHVIGYMSCVLLPLVCVLGFFVSGANTGRKDYTELLPIMENGWNPVLRGMVVVGGGFAELLFFVLFAGYADKPFKRIHLFVTGFIIVMLSLGPVVGVLTEFGPYEAMVQRYPAFAQWRLVQIGRYFEHVDFFAIYQWLSGAFVRTAGSLCLLMDLLGLRKRMLRFGVGAAIGAAAVVFVQYPFGDDQYYHFFERYFPLSLCIFIALLVYLLLIAALPRRGGEPHAANGS